MPWPPANQEWAGLHICIIYANPHQNDVRICHTAKVLYLNIHLYPSSTSIYHNGSYRPPVTQHLTGLRTQLWTLSLTDIDAVHHRHRHRWHCTAWGLYVITSLYCMMKWNYISSGNVRHIHRLSCNRRRNWRNCGSFILTKPLQCTSRRSWQNAKSWHHTRWLYCTSRCGKHICRSGHGTTHLCYPRRIAFCSARIL